MGILSACVASSLVAFSITLNGCGGETDSPAVLPRCASGDQLGWPTFYTRSQLQASPWGKYFELVYGEIPSTGYPICTLGQTMLYKPHLATAGLTAGGYFFSPSHTLDHACPTQGGEWYNYMTDHEADWASWIWNPNLASPVSNSLPSNAWVEVLHQAYHGDGAATWFYYAPGTSVWVFLGETKAYDDHADAVQDLLGANCSDPHAECVEFFPRLYDAMPARNLNTIQFLKHSDMACWHNLAIEIVDLGGSGEYACGQSHSGTTRFKAGWQAQHDCTCNNTVSDHVLNCDGFGMHGTSRDDADALSVSI